MVPGEVVAREAAEHHPLHRVVPCQGGLHLRQRDATATFDLQPKLPPTVRGAIRQRLQRLSPVCNRLLALAESIHAGTASDFGRQLDRTIDRATMGIMTASLVIGSPSGSIVLQQNDFSVAGPAPGAGPGPGLQDWSCQT